MRIILLISILLSASFAQLPEAKYKLKMKEIDKKACKEFKNSSICYNVSLKYPLTDILRKDIAQILQMNIDATKKEILKENPNKILSDINEEDVFGSKEWSSETTIELFDYFKNFTTVSTFQYDYTGGAHPNSSLSLFAFKNGSKKALKLKDIVGSGNMDKFISVAEKEYKLYVGLLPYESLTKDGWFENNFELTKNFAITDKGLLLNYNPYEIKPYSAGYTYFILPYYVLQNIIGKDSAIYDLLEESEYKNDTRVIDEQFINSGELKASLKVSKYGVARLDISLELYKDFRYLWVSIGTPQYIDDNNVYIVDYKGLDRFDTYPAGSKIYNITKKRSIRAKYLLVEGSKKRYHAYNDISATLLLKAPKNSDIVCVELRVTAKNRDIKRFINSSFVDQQGFESKRMCIRVKNY